MRVVIVGASGNAGTALLRRLSREPDMDLVGICRRLPPELPPYDVARWHALDVGSAQARRRLSQLFHGADAVVHLAWQIQPSHDQAVLHRTNVEGSRAVFGAVTDAGVPALLYASSVGAYGPGPKDRPVDEQWPTSGVAGSSYSRDKSTVEGILDSVDGVRVVRLRPGLIFQRDVGTELARYFLGPFVPTRWLRAGRIPVVPSHPRLRLPAVHADDVAEAFLLALRGDAHGAFNIARAADHAGTGGRALPRSHHPRTPGRSDRGCRRHLAGPAATGGQWLGATGAAGADHVVREGPHGARLAAGGRHRVGPA